MRSTSCTEHTNTLSRLVGDGQSCGQMPHDLSFHFPVSPQIVFVPHSSTGTAVCRPGDCTVDDAWPMTTRDSQKEPTAHPEHAGRFDQERVVIASLVATSDTVKSEVVRLAGLAGVEVVHSRPTVNAVLRMVEVSGATPQIEASFHPSYAPYFASGKVHVSLPDQAEDLLELLLAAGSTRRGMIMEVFGSHGGAGASTLASWLARRMSESDAAGLIDLDPMSLGLDHDLGMHKAPGLRWADLSEKSGALVPGRLNAALPQIEQLRVLSADERGSAPLEGSSGERAIAALSQVNTTTVLDLPRQATQGDDNVRGWLGWCDVAVVVTRAHSRGLRHTRKTLDQLPADIVPVVVVNGASGGAEAAAIALELRCDHVLPLRRLRNLEQDLEHGVRLGDRRRCNTARDVARIEAFCLGVA